MTSTPSPFFVGTSATKGFAGSIFILLRPAPMC